MKAGHKGGAEFWRGAAGAYFTANPLIKVIGGTKYTWITDYATRLQAQGEATRWLRDGFTVKITESRKKKSFYPYSLWVAESSRKQTNPPKTIGRVDWMPRKKVWRVILYQGKKDVPFGDFASVEEAKSKLQSMLRKKNPFVDALVTGVGFGAGLMTMKHVFNGMKKKNPRKK